MANMPLSFSFYRFVTRIISPFLPLVLQNRIGKGKEAIDSKSDRFGNISITKTGAKLFWIHCASVGETMLGISIAKKLQEHANLQFIFTAQTIAAKEVFLKANLINANFQFAPFDTPKIAKDFITNLMPDLAIFVEGEIWPNLIYEIENANIKRILINARMTQKSLENWQKYPKLAQFLFGGFAFIHCANQQTQNAIYKICDYKAKLCGNLKLSVPIPKTDDALINQIKSQLKNRKIWLCASSHEGEEEIIINTQKALVQKQNDILLIIAPRHLKRVDAIIEMSKANDLKCQSKTQNQSINEDTKIFIWDTLGELGSAYRVADCAFIAGSLLPHIGGHNPIEPAQLHCPILSGPYFHNFADIYGEMKEKGAAIITKDDSNSIANSVFEVLENEKTRENLIEASNQYIDENQGMIDKVSIEIMGLL